MNVTTTFDSKCPVDWCPGVDFHEWDVPVSPDDSASRTHALPVLDVQTGEYSAVRVEAEYYETTEGVAVRSVQIPGNSELFTWGQVDQVINALREAATLAFGPVPASAEEGEMNAAMAELLERADRPTDVNRLVGAAVRVRRARLALVELTR